MKPIRSAWLLGVLAGCGCTAAPPPWGEVAPRPMVRKNAPAPGQPVAAIERPVPASEPAPAPPAPAAAPPPVPVPAPAARLEPPVSAGEPTPWHP
jgi:hypothetical protein